MESQWIQNWISLQDNPRTRSSYILGMRKFVDYCRTHNIDGLETLVQDYREANYDNDRRKLAQYTDAWNDVLQGYTIWLKSHCAPASMKTYLAILQSAFSTSIVQKYYRKPLWQRSRGTQESIQRGLFRAESDGGAHSHKRYQQRTPGTQGSK